MIRLGLIFLLMAGAADDRGTDLLKEKGCLQCHSIAGAGGSKAPSLDGVGKRLKKQAIEQQILHGGQEMPAFEDSVTPEELHIMVEFLHRAKKSLKT